MAGFAWPERMPRPLQGSYSMQPEDRRLAGSVDAGTYFSPGFGGDFCSVECSLRLDPLQAAWLESLERDSLAQGAAWVDFPLWYSGGLHWEECRFTARPRLTAREGLHCVYQLRLQCRRRSALGADPGTTEWPSSLPAPQASLTYEPEDVRISTDMEVGQLIRRQFSTDVVKADCELILSPAQAATFEAFENGACRNLRWFSMPLWLAGELQAGSCQILERPKWSPAGKMTRYRFSVLVSEREISIDACTIDLLQHWTEREAIRTAQAFEDARRAIHLSTVKG